jgi:glycosyltransferase involved in cell wall biosynthesis
MKTNVVTYAAVRQRDKLLPNAVILIPAYNASATIAETLDALQANPALDCIKAVIMLDDNSRDGTMDAAKSAWRSTVPLKIWSNEVNTGERTTTNSGLARLPADIEWAFILHADDVVIPNWISLYLNEMTDCPDDVATICSSYDSWYPGSGQIEPGEEYPDRPAVLVSGTRQAVLDTLDRGCWWHISGCAIRTIAFRHIGDFKPDMPQAGDWEWLLRCLANGFSVLYLPRSTMRYRQNTSSVSSLSFRQARDIRERLEIFAAYRDQGYLSPGDCGRKVRNLLWQLSRRTLGRAARGDLISMRQHGRLLAEVSVKYLLRRI